MKKLTWRNKDFPLSFFFKKYCFGKIVRVFLLRVFKGREELSECFLSSFNSVRSFSENSIPPVNSSRQGAFTFPLPILYFPNFFVRLVQF